MRGTAVAVVLPAYDALTRVMSRAGQAWCARLGWAAAGIGSPYLLAGEGATRAGVLDCLKRMNGDANVIVFAGHGDPDGWLTCPGGAPEDPRAKGDRFLGAADIVGHERFRALGLCCHSAEEFGPAVGNRERDRQHVGFIDKLGFVFGSEEREAALLGPFLGVCADVVLGNLKRGAGEQLRGAYSREHELWMSGARGRGDKSAGLVAFLLDEHAEQVREAP